MAEEEDVGGQHGPQPAHHHREPHPDPPDYRGELLGREEVEDGVGTVGGEPSYDGDRNSHGGIVGRHKGVSAERQPADNEEQTEAPLPPEHWLLQGEDDVDVSRDLNPRRDKEAEIFVIRELGLVQQEDVVEAGAGDPAQQEDQSLTAEVGISEEVHRRVGPPGLLLRQLELDGLLHGENELLPHLDLVPPGCPLYELPGLARPAPGHQPADALLGGPPVGEEDHGRGGVEDLQQAKLRPKPEPRFNIYIN